ncbi:MAG: LamG-like jellyroll fold domain-containing protein [Candidatus Cloacimonadaceae bacterium]|nr:LamG-like jellyroll fold domain-containing protein [Candidatus Cloacimonadaceae bacterium]
MKLKFYVLMMLVLASAVLYAQGNVNAVYFDGVNDHVQVSTALGVGTTYTVEGWFRANTLSGGPGDTATFGRTLFSASATSGIFPFWVTVYGTSITLRTWTTDSAGVSFNAGLTTGQWYHIAVTSVKGGLTILYLNGFNVFQYTNPGTASVVWPSTFTIGAIRPVRPLSLLPFGGLIDEVRVWTTIRTPGDILANMSSPISPIPTGLVGYWKFDEAAPGTTAFDSAGTAQNGTLANGAFFTPSDLTLPIELSSFNAVPHAQNYVVLHWVTQSETDVMGYYIYRNTINDISSAIRVSPLIAATNSSSQTSYQYEDSEVTPGQWYYWLQNIDFNGGDSFHGPVICTLSDGGGGGSVPVLPLISGFEAIYPNPFNPTAKITYNVSNAANVSISIYNSRGQLAKTFNEGSKEAGQYNVLWNGLDESGSACSSGIYMFRMSAGNEVYSRKAVLMK